MATTATPITTETPAKTATPTQPVPLEQLTEEQHVAWLKTGELPIQGDKRARPLVRADKDGNLPADADTDVDADAKVDDKPAPAPAKKGVGNLTYRELRAKVRAQEAELERLRTRGDVQVDDDVVDDEPASTEVPARADTKTAAPRPKSTDLDDKGKAKYATWEDYEDALLEWNTERVLAKADEHMTEREQQRAIARANAEIEKDWSAKVDEASGKYDDFATVALDKKTGPYELIKPGSAIDQWILKRPLGAELLYYFGKNRAELLRIGRMHPVDASAELVELESKLKPTTSRDKGTAATDIKVTKTPRPASEVGGRGTAAVDDVAKALHDDPTKSEDAMRRFMAAENEREIRERLGERRR